MSEPSEFEARDWLESFCDDQADNVLNLLNEQINETTALTARAVTAEADLAVVVEFLRAVCHRTGESPDYWIGFFFDGGSNAPATLRRLLGEDR